MSKARKLLLGSILFLTLHSTAHAHSCPLGEITPDTTLGKESSVVAPNSTINGASAELINGGQMRGNNLFHSFTQFNIGDGQRVYFANPAGVQNILTRSCRWASFKYFRDARG